MNTKKSLRLINIFITAFVLVMVPFLNGCGESDAKVYKTIESHDGEDYRTFVANEGIPHFSFEYPSYYELVSYQPMPVYLGTSVILSGPFAEEEKGNIKHVEITVDKYLKSAKSGLDWRIDDYKSGLRAGLMKEFKILEKNRVIVAGTEGWEIVVSFTETGVSPSVDLPVREGPTPIVSRNMFFENQDMIWEIFLYSDAATNVQAKADYEHIVRTFRFLD